jgi:exopolyphosphatase/guanosine-5'-triphosphate,3'-diphosphate pyrophosphatase
MAELLIRFQREAELLGAAIRAVALQSFRTLPNHQHLLKRLPRVTRVALEMISDREVARLVCLGALPGRPPGSRTLVIDVGEETTSLILADGEQPLALWRLAVGTGRLLAGAAGNGARERQRVRAASWRRQVQQALSLGHLHTARGAASEAVLITSRAVNPPAAAGDGAPTWNAGGEVANLAATTFVEEIASYLQIRKVQATEGGLHTGILRDLSRRLDEGPFTPGVAAR